jgi:hypothetical protein
LTALAQEPAYTKLVTEERTLILNLFETVFDHGSFTGRSGTFFAFEGLGSIYWHMVSKLLLAVAEVIEQAGRHNADREQMAQLMACFDDIQAGIGVHKTPQQYGAFPIDPYSHTPGFTGVQQPGMTGQVKEDVITRFIELGVKVRRGQVSFEPAILKRDEFLSGSARWNHPSGKEWRRDDLGQDSLAFTLCAVTVIYRVAQEYAIKVFDTAGSSERIPGNCLGEEASRALFHREGRIRKIVVDIPADLLR